MVRLFQTLVIWWISKLRINQLNLSMFSLSLSFWNYSTINWILFGTIILTTTCRTEEEEKKKQNQSHISYLKRRADTGETWEGQCQRMHTLSCVCVMDSWGLMNERVALQPRTRAADRNPIRISSPSAGRVVVDTGERGPHMLTILARIQLLNACIASNQAGRALLRMETEILRRWHESMTWSWSAVIGQQFQNWAQSCVHGKPIYLQQPS